MPCHNFKCDKCGFVDEYFQSISIPKDMLPPKKCPKCKKGKMEKLFSPQRVSFDVVGGYDYQYGKKAWKKNMSIDDQSRVLAGEKDPY